MANETTAEPLRCYLCGIELGDIRFLVEGVGMACNQHIVLALIEVWRRNFDVFIMPKDRRRALKGGD